MVPDIRDANNFGMLDVYENQLTLGRLADDVPNRPATRPDI